MNYHIDEKASSPAYIQLYYLLRQDIITGVYPGGSKLPSKRTIAADTGLSLITVEHALELLCDEGYTESRERSGCFVIYREDDFQGAPESGPEPAGTREWQPHSGSEFPFSVMARTMRKVLQDYGDDILVRSPKEGSPELRKQICAYIARSRGMKVEPSQIIIGAGAEYLYSLVAQLLGRNRVFGLEDPSYHVIRKVYESLGINCEMLKLGENGISSDSLSKTDATVLHVTPFHSYPSGVTVGVSKKKAYLRWADNCGGYIIEDNYDSELTVSRKAEDSLFSMSENGRVIYINTFSKTIAPSIRVGYMILPKNLAEQFEKQLGFYSCTVPLFEQYVLAQLLGSGDFERHINRVRRIRRKSEKQNAVK